MVKKKKEKEEEAGLTLLLADHGREGAYAIFFFSLFYIQCPRGGFST
jgi:hypothetical protein